MKRFLLTFAVFFLILITLGQCQGQVKEKVNRLPAVAGSFYPANRQELLTMLDGFFIRANSVIDSQPLALVVPHAGYVFSGPVAAAGFKQLDRERTFKHIFIIGPAHRMYFEGAMIYTLGDFITPLGNVPVDGLADELVSKNKSLGSDPAPHAQEHCIEVQLPFLQYWLKKPFSIVPILIGGESQETVRQLAAILAPYFTPENLFIISSDFSHYPPYSDAVKADRLTANAIITNNPKEFLTVKTKNEHDFSPGLETAMCGWMPMLTLLQITEKRKDVEFRKILYQNSGDSKYGDRDKVVGYWALAVVKKQQQETRTDFKLSDNEKNQLLTIARSTITAYLKNKNIPTVDENSFSANLKVKTGAFVTLRENRELRGCVGNFFSEKPLYRVIQEMAIAAATRDTRFSPVQSSEMENIEIEISVLTPLHRIYSIDEFKLGRDGIYIKKGNRSGTFLPQVANDTHWTVEEFMGHCAQDKAFIGWDGWKEKDVELYTYRALVFGETRAPATGSKK